MDLFPKLRQDDPPAHLAGDLAKHQRTLPVLLFWLALWQIGAWAVGSHILLAGPLQVAKALASLLPTGAFWRSVATSFVKIGLGFLAAFFTGIFVGGLAFHAAALQILLAPAITFMNSVPLASFIILALIWTGSEDLSVLTSYLVVFPVIYINTIAGLKSTDEKLLEMAKVFQFTGWRKLAGLYWPALLPYLISGCRTALGMSWKAGIAAEVIGVPAHTIGEQLYLSKVYLSTAELFAWTFAIILISLLSEKAFLLLLKQTGTRLFLPFDRAIPPFSTRYRSDQSLLGSSAQHADNDSPDDRDPQAGPTLTVKGLEKRFGRLQILRQLSFHVRADRPGCIMGPSGSGKTTLLGCLLGLEPPDAGTVMLSVPPCGCNRPASAVFQEDRLCEGFSPIDNIRLAIPGLPAAKIRRELTKILPEECLTRPVSTLSGGMKRRTAIARALLSFSDMVVMDEPFTGLDDETRQEVIRFVLEKSTGRILLLSTHQKEDVAQLEGELIWIFGGSSFQTQKKVYAARSITDGKDNRSR